MQPETLSRIFEAMRPARDRLSAEEHLIRARRVYRVKGHQAGVEDLLDASGAFYGRFSHYALDARREDVYRLLLTAWYEVVVAYESGDTGIGDKAFQLYSVAVTHRIVVT